MEEKDRGFVVEMSRTASHIEEVCQSRLKFLQYQLFSDHELEIPKADVVIEKMSLCTPTDVFW